MNNDYDDDQYDGELTVEAIIAYHEAKLASASAPKPPKSNTPDRRINELLMTVEELARFAKLSISKIYHDVEAGRIPVMRWGRKQTGKKPIIRFKKSEILIWLNWGCPNARDFREKQENLTLTGAK